MLSNCERCNGKYHREKSTAELKYIYCSMLCQSSDMYGTVRDIISALDDIMINRIGNTVTEQQEVAV